MSRWRSVPTSSSRRAAITVYVSLAVVYGGAAAVVLTLHPLIERHRVPSESMEPGVQRGDVVSLNRRVYRDAAPELGDIVIFHPPQGAAEGAECGVAHPRTQVCPQPTRERTDSKFIKRIVAGPGDRIAVEGGQVVLDGKRLTEPHIAQSEISITRICDVPEFCDLPKEITVPPNHYFVMGDNRGASDDSRFWGPVPREWILGRVERCRALILACSPQR